MFYFIFLFLSPLIEVLSNHPPNFKFLVPLGNSSSHILSPTYSCCTFLSAEVSWCKCSVFGGMWQSLTVIQKSALSVVWSQMFYSLFSLWKEDCFDLLKKKRRIPFVLRFISTFWKYTRILYLTMCTCQKYFNLHACIKFSKSFTVLLNSFWFNLI